MLLIIGFIIGFILISFLISPYLKRFVGRKSYKIFSNYLIIFIVLFLVITIIIFPAESVDAAYNGLIVWATLVIPALLPFFIGSELLINLGVVRFIGILLEPIMRPVFNVPGEGSFAFAMSITSGYPVGAKIVSKLRTDKFITPVEAQRLISFCSTSGPLFMIGSVSVGMFRSSKLGILIVTSHYLGSIIVGIIFSFYKRSLDKKKPTKRDVKLVKKAFSYIAINGSQAPPIGVILGNAVKNSFNTIIMVGGFIILFAVIIEILELLGLINLITSIFVIIFPFKISPEIIHSLITGIFEVTMGTKLVADSMGIDLATKVAIASFIIGWSGFSIHAQVVSIIGNTGIKPHLYIVSKALHGLFSSLIAYMFFHVFNNYFVISYPVYNSYQSMSHYKKFLFNCQLSVELFIAILISLLFLSLLTTILFKIRDYIVCRKG